MIQPLHMSTFTDTAQNLGGATIVKQGIKATFPLEAFRQDNKIVLIFEDKEYGFDIGKIMFEKGHVSATEQSAAPIGGDTAQVAGQAQADTGGLSTIDSLKPGRSQADLAREADSIRAVYRDSVSPDRSTTPR